METDKKYTAYVKASVETSGKASIKGICIADSVDKAEEYFDKEEGDE